MSYIHFQNPFKKKPTGDAKKRKRPNHYPKRPSADVAALIDAIKDEGAAARNEEQREDGGKSLRDWVTIFLLLCTLVAIGWQVTEMIKVYEPIKEQADAAKNAATFARQTAEAAIAQSKNAERTLISSQRAWVGPGLHPVWMTPT